MCGVGVCCVHMSVTSWFVCLNACGPVDPVDLFVVNGVLMVGPVFSLMAQDPGSVKNALMNSQ